MVTFVIFWASFFAIICFILKIALKALDSALTALFSTAGIMLKLGTIAFLAALALDLLSEIVSGAASSGVETVIEEVILLILEFGISGAVYWIFGAIIFDVVVRITDFILCIVSIALLRASYICDIGYSRLLAVIVRQIEKC